MNGMDLLIIRQSAFGDILHLFPAIDALKKVWPKARIYLLVKERFKPFASMAPCVEAVWTVPERPVDAVIDCQGLMKTAWLAFKCKSPLKGGYSWKDVREKPAALLYNRRVRVSSRHVIDQHAELLSGILGAAIDVDKAYRSDFLVGDDPDIMTYFSSIPSPRILVHPTSSQMGKHLSADEWKPIMEIFLRRGCAVILSCGPGEDGFLLPWKEHFPDAHVAPLVPLEKLADLVSNCQFVLGADTGIIHLADQLGLPVLSWFSLWPPERNGPYFSRSLVFYRRSPDAGEVSEWLEGLQ